ncbi:MAG: glycoside hydrolase family 18 protein [Capsulimonadaceae bacterium]|nr:glycoside hydrolase family 18 protein [Capsulimonadaceae bacterium]
MFNRRVGTICAQYAIALIATLCAICVPSAAASHEALGAPPLWVTAYYAVWSQERHVLDPREIDFSAITHLIHFAVEPAADGSIDTSKGRDVITPAQSADVIAAAHAAGRPVLLCVGGDAGGAGFHAAVHDPPARSALEATLVKLVVDRGYDGLDIDFEPLNRPDVADFDTFVRDMRAQLNAAKPGLMMTAAAGSQQVQEYASVQDLFDQINLMTYDLSGRWIGPVTWFNSCLQNAGNRLLPRGTPCPSVSGRVKQFLDAGVNPKKLSIGTAFYGFIWNGANGPLQAFADAAPRDIAYSRLMDQYYAPAVYRWDGMADAPYLSIDASDPAKRLFISYDDERLIRDKVRYARTHGLGGVMIWELGDGYRRNQPSGQRDLLLKAVKDAVNEPSP